MIGAHEKQKEYLQKFRFDGSSDQEARSEGSEQPSCFEGKATKLDKVLRKIYSE